MDASCRLSGKGHEFRSSPVAEPGSLRLKFLILICAKGRQRIILQF